MNKQFFSAIAPHIFALLLFIILSYVYFTPVLEGKQLLGHDTESWMCMAKETVDYNETNDDVTLWTNSMFGGMPNYQISMLQPYNLVSYIESIFKVFKTPVFFLLLYFVGFYILLLLFGAKPWLAIAGPIAFTFSLFNFIFCA